MTATFDCEDDELYQIEYWFNVQGPVPDGDFIPIGTSLTASAIYSLCLLFSVCTAAYDQGSCRSSGIKYLPKNEDGSESSGERSRSRRRRRSESRETRRRWHSADRLTDEV